MIPVAHHQHFSARFLRRANDLVNALYQRTGCIDDDRLSLTKPLIYSLSDPVFRKSAKIRYKVELYSLSCSGKKQASIIMNWARVSWALGST